MTEQDEVGIASNTHDDNSLGESDAKVVPCPRLEAVRDLVADATVCEAVGAAWRLWLRLLLIEGGSMTGTREELGQKLGVSGRNVGNWVTALQNNGIVKVCKTGRKMKVELADQHMSVALMPDIVTVDGGAKARPELDDHQRSVLRLMDDARAVGGKVEIRIAVGER